MKVSARLRQAVSLAAAITSVALGKGVADEPGPETAKTIPTEAPAKADASAPAKKRESYPFQGVIAFVDVKARTLTLEGKQTRRVIQLSEATRLLKEGKPATWEDLKAGEKVGGTLKKDSTGKEEALLVRVGPKSDEEKSAGAAKKQKPKEVED